MSVDGLTSLIQQALVLIAWLSIPFVFVAAIVGLLWGFFQAVTQINDQTAGFAIKLICVAIACVLSLSWVGGELKRFGTSAFDAVKSIRR
ncbi:MAG: type III secretion system export apparatus subunit SctS [Casimicrobium sp.]